LNLLNILNAAVRGMSITALTIVEFLSAGDSKEDILLQYHSLKI